MQRAFDTGRSVRLLDGASYLVSSRLSIASNNITVSGSGRIKVDPNWDFAADTTDGESGPQTHLRVIFVTGWNVTVSGVVFDATGTTGGTGVENCFFWLMGGAFRASECQFLGLPKGAAIMGLGSAPYFCGTGCQIINCAGGFFAKGRNPLMSNNLIVNCVDAALTLNGVFLCRRRRVREYDQQ